MLTAGAVLGHYEIREPLGAGGMGRVYRAWDQRLEREVAVKVLPDHLVDDPQARARFEREAKAALSHPNILAIHDYGEEGEVAYSVMELLEGETLAERLADSGEMPVDEVLRVGTAAARGLAAAHARGILHRDIKPANLFLCADGQVKILDFGLARSIGRELADLTEAETQAGMATTPGTVLGTVGYMSPEQARGEEATAASDVFSLGCVLYQMSTGRSPFERESAGETLAAILTEDPPPIAGSGARPVPGLQRLLSRCLARDGAQRLGSGTELVAELESLASDRSGPVPGWLAAAALMVLLLGGLWLLLSRGDSEVEQARREGLPRLLALIEEEEYFDAFVLARELEEVLPEDSVVAGIWDDVSDESSFATDPPGAEVSLRPPTGGEWFSLGTTPLEDVRFPFGVYRWRVAREGFETREFTFPSPLFSGPMPLLEEGSLPSGMLQVFASPAVHLNLSNMPPERGAVPNFLVGRFEVTNREFQAFVDAGGYTDRSLWKHPFVEADRTLSWEQAMERFRDSTGRPGPLTWELGRYPEGKEAYPVQGVSWYEAAAYAEFADAELPTVFHWAQAASTSLTEAIVPVSNFEGEGPAPVGRFSGVTSWGVYDMAGNVREWCWNRDGERRYILGGNWTEPTYAFHQPNKLPPMDRSPENGVRIVRNLGAPPDGYDAGRELTARLRDPSDPRRAPPEFVELWRSMVAYDEKPLDVRQEEESAVVADWSPAAGEGAFTVERISYNAAYGGERIAAHLFLPQEVQLPYQPVIYFPGDGMMNVEELARGEWEFRRVEFLVRSGRALVFPTYKSSFGRRDGLRGSNPMPGRPLAWQEHLVQWVQDVMRTVDYLETRDDMDLSKLGYFGFSWGGFVPVYLLPVETRIRTAILMSGGVGSISAHDALPNTVFDRYPNTDLTLLGEVTIPLLMLNGKYDQVFPVEQAQKLLIEALGTPEEAKRHVVFPEAGHSPLPRHKVIRESLDFLDQHLGPVEGRETPGS